MRLAKFLAHGGVASRRAAEKLIAAGAVTVDRELVTDPARGVDESNEVVVAGRGRVSAEPREVWAVNKPLQVTSTAREPGRRRPVTDLVDSPRRLYPIGRLDADSAGLILLTNDGELANRLTHPRYEIPKTYRIRLARPITAAALDRLREGVELEDGMTAPAEVVSRGRDLIEMTIREGRNRQVRRMVDRVGNRVRELDRIRFGSIELGDLARAGARQLSEAERRRLWEDSKG